MLKKKLLLVWVSILLSMGGWSARAQYHGPNNELGIAIHINNPISLIQKLRVKFEYRLATQHAMLLSYTSYYGFFPGYQFGVEYRNYHELRGEHEYYFYGKLGGGESKYRNAGFLTGTEKHYDPGTYAYAGGGVGKRFNFDAFFIDTYMGLKYTYVIDPAGDYNELLFYSLGPGAVFDAGLHIGLQF